MGSKLKALCILCTFISSVSYGQFSISSEFYTDSESNGIRAEGLFNYDSSLDSDKINSALNSSNGPMAVESTLGGSITVDSLDYLRIFNSFGINYYQHAGIYSDRSLFKLLLNGNQEVKHVNLDDLRIRLLDWESISLGSSFTILKEQVSVKTRVHLALLNNHTYFDNEAGSLHTSANGTDVSYDLDYQLSNSIPGNLGFGLLLDINFSYQIENYQIDLNLNHIGAFLSPMTNVLSNKIDSTYSGIDLIASIFNDEKSTTLQETFLAGDTGNFILRSPINFGFSITRNYGENNKVGLGFSKRDLHGNFWSLNLRTMNPLGERFEIHGIASYGKGNAIGLGLGLYGKFKAHKIGIRSNQLFAPIATGFFSGIHYGLTYSYNL